MIRSALLLLIYLWPVASSAQTSTGLFDSDEPLVIVLETDLQALMNDLSEDPAYQKGKMIQKTGGASITFLNVEVRTRGKSRRKSGLCEMPPLMLNFRHSQSAGTPYEGLKKVMLVNQCRSDIQHERYLVREYLVYRTYNILTEFSYRLRPVHITYRDSRRAIPDQVMMAFLIEPDELLAARTGSELYKLPVYSQDSCDIESTNIMSLFQYMIGNTDWYVNTRHNMRIFQRQDIGFVPVPYDFDMSGAVNAHYATPAPNLGIKSVRERFFKGTCRPEEVYTSPLELLKSKKEDMYQVIQESAFGDPGNHKVLLKYYDQFYHLMSDPGKRADALANLCRPDPYNLLKTLRTKKSQPF